jgi:hypothetical protein
LADEEAKRVAEEKRRIAQEEERKRAAEEKKHAVQEAEKIASSAGNSESERLEKACLFREHGLLDDAKRELILVVTSHTDDPTKARALYLLGVIAFDQNHIRVALETWRQLTEKYPKSKEAVSVGERIKELAQIVGESQKEHIDNVVAESYLRHADFWSEHKDEIFIIDASWIDHVEAANKWYDRVIREFPKTLAARLAYEEKIRTLLGWKDPGQYGDWHGVRADHDKYIPRVIETFNQFEADFPDAATLPAFRFQIAQAYWRKDDQPNCRKWLNAIIEKAGVVDTFYVDLAKRRLVHMEHKD